MASNPAMFLFRSVTGDLHLTTNAGPPTTFTSEMAAFAALGRYYNQQARRPGSSGTPRIEVIQVTETVLEDS